jgi:hypothetical protein
MSSFYIACPLLMEAVTVAESMAKLRMNLQNPITFQPWVQMLHAMARWKATIHIYYLQKIQKIQKKLHS